MKVLIYGGGAVGLGIASCILNSGNSVDIVARESSVKLLRDRGLKREGIFGSVSFTPDRFSAASSVSGFKNNSYDYILVSTKSFDSENAAKELSGIPGLLSGKGIIILSQNGWGNAEKFTEYFPREKIYNARVITGFTLINKNEVNITVHADAVHIGSLYNDDIEILKPLTDAITRGGLECVPYAEIERDLWTKMLYNCSLNALGAIFGVPYGKLSEHEESRRIINSIIDEVYAVMNAAGFKTNWETAGEYRKALYEKLIPVTAEHKSSTLQDIQAGKKTEIDALNGVIIKLGDQYKIPVTVNRILFEMVQFKTEIRTEINS